MRTLEPWPCYPRGVSGTYTRKACEGCYEVRTMPLHWRVCAACKGPHEMRRILRRKGSK